MKTITLVIMAAGIGSRFGGGIKQLTPIDDNGHVIMDYSIHDAIEAGFNKIVFIIRRDIEADFKEIIGNRIEKACDKHGVEVHYCFQDINDIPDEMPEGRTKPWGTGQAVLAADKYINGSFAVINADDYYGKEAFRKLYEWLNKPHKDNEICMAGFVLKNTLSDNGGVTRGLCKLQENSMKLSEIVETQNIIKTADDASSEGISIDPNRYVSMNLWGFPEGTNGSKPEFLNVLATGFEEFFKYDVKENPLKAEYLLPTVIGKLVANGLYTVDVCPTHDKWFGVTYAEDKQSVIDNFRHLLDAGVYGKEL